VLRGAHRTSRPDGVHRQPMRAATRVVTGATAQAPALPPRPA
jgi:hypothetical protein